jgi:ribonuclease HI
MSEPVRLFIETIHHAAFRYGGWAYARQGAGGVAGPIAGHVGGERNTTAGRIELNALVAALQGLPPGPVAIHSASPGVVRAARLLAAPPTPGSDDAPAEDLDLWAQALTAAKGRSLTVAPAPDPVARFLHAWAEVGQDKAKGQGRFAAAIPKPNLAKLALP